MFTLRRGWKPNMEEVGDRGPVRDQAWPQTSCVTWGYQVKLSYRNTSGCPSKKPDSITVAEGAGGGAPLLAQYGPQATLSWHRWGTLQADP